MKDITFAIIGSGFMGDVLARVSHELPYVHCVASADIDMSRANKMVESYGGKSYTDFNEMLEKESPDAVIVATPEFTHREAVVAAAQKGCHIFVEKPFATSLEDADAMIKACAEARVKLMTGHILRFETNYAMIQSAIQEGSIGRFLSAYARRNATISEARRLHGRVSPITYIAVHDIDLMLWYHPSPIKSVYARALKGRVWDEFQTYDCAWITIEFADGALGIQEVGWCLPEEWAKWQRPTSWGGFGDVRMNVVGTDGALNLNFTPMGLYGCDREGWKFPDTRHWPTVH
ncbi:MAG: Gfo/Idh/MocA family oxidoreductase, partial [Anaerolineales bacterium]|nr:Gfo/Idh/MocA family oxidoreductase [Anaerolineales bacterium]